MKLEDQVCSLELAKKLKELGFRQESIYAFHDVAYEDATLVQIGNDPHKWSKQFVAAFTSEELIDKIEQSANEWSCGYNDSGCFYHFRKGSRGSGNMIDSCHQPESRFDSEATPFVNALTEWVIHLIEKGLMKP